MENAIIVCIYDGIMCELHTYIDRQHRAYSYFVNFGKTLLNAAFYLYQSLSNVWRFVLNISHMLFYALFIDIMCTSNIYRNLAVCLKNKSTDLMN